VVKIRKGQAAQLILACNDMASVDAWFHHFATRIARATPPDDPSRAKILAACEQVLSLTAGGARKRRTGALLAWAVAALVLFCALAVSHLAMGARSPFAALGLSG